MRNAADVYGVQPPFPVGVQRDLNGLGRRPRGGPLKAISTFLAPMMLAVSCAGATPATREEATLLGVMAQSNPIGAVQAARAVGAQFQRITVPLIVPFYCGGRWTYAVSASGSPAVSAGGTSIPVVNPRICVAGGAITSPALPAGTRVTAIVGDVLTVSQGVTQNVYSVTYQLPNVTDSAAAGIPIYLVVRNSLTAYITGSGPIRTTDEDYKDMVSKTVSTICALVKCLFIAIESEPDLSNSAIYTTSQYLRMLDDAVPVIHALGYKVSDGGFSTPSTIFYEWACLMYTDCNRTRSGIARQRAADAFASASLRLNIHTRAAYSLLPTYSAPDDNFVSGRRFVAARIRKVAGLIAGYRRSGQDYINFHEYYIDPITAGKIIRDVSVTAGLIPIEGEVGNDNDDATYVTAVSVEARNIGIPYLLWWDFDTTGGVRALTNRDGTLRPSGQAFANLIAARGRRPSGCARGGRHDRSPIHSRHGGPSRSGRCGDPYL